MKASSFQGLTEAQAAERLASFGYNDLPKSRRSRTLGVLWRVLQEPMLLLLLCCGSIYLFWGEFRDGVPLFASAILIVGITLFQEVRSERALDALRNLTSPRALVIRNGLSRRIPGREVVPGDLLQLSEGDRVPADAELISSLPIAVDESLLTGECFSVLKAGTEDSNRVQLYSGTLVVSGEGVARVTKTGPHTQLGKIGSSLDLAPEFTTPLQKEIQRIVRLFGALAIFVSIGIAIAYGTARSDWSGGILAGLAAAMSLLPEEFPVVLTIFLAMGAWRIARNQVLTRRVGAIEGLGAISVLCVDKTGTITQNKMVLKKAQARASQFESDSASYSSAPVEVQELFRVSALACHQIPFDPMERAIMDSAAGLLNDATTLVKVYPLSSQIMAMSCVWKLKDDPELLIAVKGAPEAILKLCRSTPLEEQAVLAEVHRLGSQGLRVLGVCVGRSSCSAPVPDSVTQFDLRYLGLIAFEDPIRVDVPHAIQECQSAGIRVIILTGDYPETALSVARNLGLADRVVTGDEIIKLDDVQLRFCIQKTSVFARVTPDQKLRIVRALQSLGERVAMTGDGVNDAPSLRWADIGVSMGGRGTDVARESSSIVLLDDSFSSLVSAIRLGRRIYDNLQKAIFFIFAIHVPIAGLAILPVILKLPLILMPIHIVFLELIIDPACSLVYEAEGDEPDLMARPPRAAGARIFAERGLLITLSQGLSILLIVMSVYVVLLRFDQDGNQARAAAFLALILSNLGLILVNRSKSLNLFASIQNPNRAFIWVCCGSILLIALVLLIPNLSRLFSFSSISFSHVIIAILAAALSLFVGSTLGSAIRRSGIKWH
ncbi:MAG: cation-translocating P-type ATPase [Bdellovibrionales bacterium]|nr:cation-translocating P-type ATPase [Bdellovibrionales bacterium]